MSDGRFSSKPLRSGASREVNRSTGEFSEKAISTDVTQAFLQSMAVQREVSALQDQALREIGHFHCAPLHRHTPTAARDLGDPLASATLVQEYLIGLVFLRVAGWLVMAFGASSF